MPTFYNFTQDGNTYSFDDVFVPADLFREGNLWVWGSDSALGDGTANASFTPVTTSAGGANWKQISAGFGVVSAIKTDGTLWVWGRNLEGQLGINDATTRYTPITTFAGGTNWKQVSSGYNHTAAIKTDGTLWIWGAGSYGRLGTNSTTNILTPVTTFAGGTNWKQVSGGYFNTAAIKTDGTLWIWGIATSGQLGNNSGINCSTPITTFAGGTNWKGVSCGIVHTAAIKTDGTLWTWGSNNNAGALGINNATSASLTPVTTFAGGNNWKQVSVPNGNRSFSGAIKTDGTLWTWGYSRFGMLGNNAGLPARITPLTTFAGGTNWKQVSCAQQTMFAVKTDGTLWVWGRGNSILGRNSTVSDVYSPITTFAGGTNWKSVAGGRSNVAALTYIDPTL